jgi:hypothetical protein
MTSSWTGGTKRGAAGGAYPATRTVSRVWQKDFPQTWLYVVTGGACFALIVSDGVVVEAPPIARRRTLGKPVNEVVSYYLRRGAEVEEHNS